jgi:glycosyltransferase involved in cell wall biosynthesis
MGGAATHLPNFLLTAGRRCPNDAFVCCVNADASLPALPPNIQLRTTGSMRNRVAHAAWDQWGIARVAVRERADALLSLLNFGPVRSPVPHVVLERNPVYFCPFYLATLGRRRALEVTATRMLAHAVMRTARCVITPSRAMRDMIRTCCPDLPPSKFRVIPHGVGDAMFRKHTALPQDAAARMAGSEGTRLLYVTHAASYKGVELLLEASRVLRDDGLLPATTWLTIAPEDWPEGFSSYVNFIARYGLDTHVRLLGRSPHEAVHLVYEAADVFVYPSLCESFGFPLVEAMASGLPVVAADLPLNHEMCGEAAVYYAARDARALAAAVARVARDPALGTRLAGAGRTRAAQFSWDQHVDAVMTVVRAADG